MHSLHACQACMLPLGTAGTGTYQLTVPTAAPSTSDRYAFNPLPACNAPLPVFLIMCAFDCPAGRNSQFSLT